MLAVLKRVVKRLRHAWPDTWCIFRGDSHFAYPEVMEWIEAQPHLSYVWASEQRGVAEAGPRSHRASQAGLCVLGAQGYPLSLDPLPSGHLVALAPGGHQGRGVRTRRQHAVVTDMEQARTQVLYRHIYCARGQMENEIKDQALPEIGAHVLSPLRGQSSALVIAFGGLCAP